VILAECDRTIGAPVDVVWRLLTTADGLNDWMSVDATVELVPGGVITWRHEDGNVVEGEVREVVPMRRFVFSYGWATGFLPVAPGSTEVTIELDAGPTTTHVRVRHAGLTEEMATKHTEGWTFFVGRLAERAEGLG
jgi:uncharacterized protein YndB with AHSA1/START domain